MLSDCMRTNGSKAFSKHWTVNCWSDVSLVRFPPRQKFTRSRSNSSCLCKKKFFSKAVYRLNIKSKMNIIECKEIY